MVRCQGSGDLVRGEGDRLYRALARHIRRGRAVHLFLGGVGRVDSLGAAAVAALHDLAAKGRGSLHLEEVSPALATRLHHVPAEQAPPRGGDEGLIVRLGDATARAWSTFVAALVFQADVLFGCVTGLFSSRNRRRGAVWRDALAIGADALPVVATIAALLGLILAFQAGHLLKDFGTSIYVANLVGIGMVREFAPLMTAIVVAGRSGSAIAAEIGAMKTNEELEALEVMGIEPVRYLVVPRIYAIAFTQPLLSTIGAMVSIVGGFVIAVTYLQLGADQYINQTIEAIRLSDLLSGLFKSFIFGQLIVLIGSFQGFRVTRGAEGVGRAATRAVVAAIFAIIVADGIITTADTLLT